MNQKVITFVADQLPGIAQDLGHPCLRDDLHDAGEEFAKLVIDLVVEALKTEGDQPT